jgi:hypothetical protein
MLFAIALLIVIGFVAFRAAPRERGEDAHVHGAGQIGLLAAVALFGVDYFTSFFYATGEMMHALHPYGLERYGLLTAGIITLANAAFGALYMFSLGVFNEGGGSYTASMRYLKPALSLIVAVVLIQDYTLTIVVSALSGSDQLLSILNLYGQHWWLHFLLGAGLAAITWYLTIRGRGESARVTFSLLGFFAQMTLVMAIGLLIANARGVAAVPATEAVRDVSVGQALYHMLSATMRGMVALTGLEAMSNGIQFVKNQDAFFVTWGRKHLPRLRRLWTFYSGKSGIGRFVQTSFLFYGGLSTFFLTAFALRFNVFDGTLGRTLVGNLAYIGFTQMPGGTVLFGVYQILSVLLLAGASMTALQDAQATEWRDVAIGEIPEFVVYRDPRGTFTRSVTFTFGAAVLIMLLVRGRTTTAVPYYGVGVFMPIMVMALAVRRHILQHHSGRARTWGAAAATAAAALGAAVFVGQIVGKWQEGGWMVLISFSILALVAHALLLSPLGRRDPLQIRRIVRDKARVQGAMGSIVEWQSLKMQEYRYHLLLFGARFLHRLGIRMPAPRLAPIAAGEYDEALHPDHPEAGSFIDCRLEDLHLSPARVSAPLAPRPLPPQPVPALEPVRADSLPAHLVRSPVRPTRS